MASTLRIAGIVPESITDGPGIRTAVFVQGCPHRCAGCHNPDSHDFSGGRDIGVDEILAAIKRNPLLGGVTLTGGEPLCQAAALTELARDVRALGLEVAVYTGYTLEALLAENDPDRRALLAETDILVDGPFVLAERSLALRFRGSRNQRILDVPRSLAAGQPVPATSPRWI